MPQSLRKYKLGISSNSMSQIGTTALVYVFTSPDNIITFLFTENIFCSVVMMGHNKLFYKLTGWFRAEEKISN